LVGSIFHMTRKIVSEMTYNVSMETLNPTIPYHCLPVELLRNCYQEFIMTVKWLIIYCVAHCVDLE